MISRISRLMSASALFALAIALPLSASAEETIAVRSGLHSSTSSVSAPAATVDLAAENRLSGDAGSAAKAEPAPEETNPPPARRPSLDELRQEVGNTFSRQNSVDGFPLYGVFFMFWTWIFWAVLLVSALGAWFFLRKYRRLTDYFIAGSRYESPSRLLATPYASLVYALSGVAVGIVCVFSGDSLLVFFRECLSLNPFSPEGRLTFLNLARYLPFLFVLFGGRLLVERFPAQRKLLGYLWLACLGLVLYFLGPKGRTFAESALFFAFGGLLWASVFVLTENLLAFGGRGLARALIVLAGNAFVFMASAQLSFLVIIAAFIALVFNIALSGVGSGNDTVCPACGGKNGLHTSSCNQMRLDGYTHGLWGWQK